MSSRTAAGRKRLQHPPLKVSPPERLVNKPATTIRADLISSTPRPRNAPRIRTSVQHLDLSNEFTQPLPSPEIPSPEYSPIYFPPSNHVHFRNIESSQAVEAAPSYGPFLHRRGKWIESDEVTRTVPTYEPPSPYEENIYQSRRPQLRVDPYGMGFLFLSNYIPEHSHIVVNYQNLPLPPHPSPAVLSRSPISPAKGPFAYVPDSPISPKYSPASTNKHFEHQATSYTPRSPSVRRSHRHSLTPTDLPDYRSTYSAHVDSHSPVAVTNNSARRDKQHSSYQYPSTSRPSPPSPHAQLAALSISQFKNERRPPFQRMTSVPDSLNHHYSFSSIRGSGRSPYDFHSDAASLSVYSNSSPSTPTSNGTWLPPAPPPSPTFFFPGSRSVARPRVTSKITISQLKKRTSKSRLRAERSQTSLTSSVSPVSPSVDQGGYETSPVSPISQAPNQTNHADVWSDESAIIHGNDFQRKAPPSVPKAPPDTLVFPTSRSRAQPKISSKPKSSKRQSLKSKDDSSGRSRIISTLFKKKNKGKTANNIPNSQMYNKLLDPVAPTGEQTPPVQRISDESSHEFNVRQEQTRKLKSRIGTYPLDPYNSVLLDNDRHTGELLSRLNRTGSPSFHDYGTTPPSSVLDLGCGQGHWVLEAAIAWKAYGTHVIGYDMVDISRNLIPWATEQGVRDNIRFVRGNFLKQHLPFGDGTFDLVRMSCLALCITSDSWGFLLEEVYRVLVTGGRLEFIDDQIFFPYGRVASLMDGDDMNSVIIDSYSPRVESILSPTVSTYSIYGDAIANPGLGSTVGLGHRNSDDDDDESDLDGGGVVLQDHKGMDTAKPLTAHPPVKPSIVLSPEDWERSLSISEGLEALFDHMLLDTFDIRKDPSEFILSILREVFGQAREVETMYLVLAPPDSTTVAAAKSAGRSFQPQQGLSHCPGLILWPSTFIPMDHTEIEIHASKHLRTLLSCKNFLAQHAIEVADDERVDDEFVSEALWEYESFLEHRFNPPEASGDDGSNTSHASTVHNTGESSNSDSFEAMLEIQTEFRQRYAWQPDRPSNKSLNSQDFPKMRTPSPSVRASIVPSTSQGSVMPFEVTHVRTFRVFEAVKLDSYVVSSYDNY